MHYGLICSANAKVGLRNFCMSKILIYNTISICTIIRNVSRQRTFFASAKTPSTFSYTARKTGGNMSKYSEYVVFSPTKNYLSSEKKYKVEKFCNKTPVFQLINTFQLICMYKLAFVTYWFKLLPPGRVVLGGSPTEIMNFDVF